MLTRYLRRTTSANRKLERVLYCQTWQLQAQPCAPSVRRVSQTPSHPENEKNDTLRHVWRRPRTATPRRCRRKGSAPARHAERQRGHTKKRSLSDQSFVRDLRTEEGEWPMPRSMRRSAYMRTETGQARGPIGICADTAPAYFRVLTRAHSPCLRAAGAAALTSSRRRRSRCPCRRR